MPTIAELLTIVKQRTLTKEESAELSQMISNRSAAEITAMFSATMTAINGREEMGEEMTAAVLENILTALPNPGFNPNNPLNPSPHRIHFLRTAWFRYAAAIILLFGIGAYLWNTNIKPVITPPVAQTESRVKDIAPGGARAVLTLADGSIINLDSAGNGQLATQGSAVITKKAGGQIEYNNPLNPSNPSNPLNPSLNTMTTPRGGQYQLTLPDGTNVWLNAASSITYPTAFVNNIREVTITGEAYFEVTKNPSKPFVVKTPKEKITVLGTSFNVNAYPDEAAMKTSLLEGSVKIRNAVLQPGQAFVNGKVIQTNVDQDVAWKNGVFDFTNVKLADAMRQIGRWYDVDVVLKGNLNSITFLGEMGRTLTLQQVLKGLEGIDDVHFKLEGRTLTVTP